MSYKKRKQPRSLTASEREELDEYFVENSGYFHYAALLFLDNPEDAEDVIQESILHAMRNIKLFLSLNTKRRNIYIAKTVCNLCVDSYRRNKQLEILTLGDDVINETPSQKDVIPGSDTHLSLLELGARLPEKEWFVLQQLYLEGAPKERVAKALECSTDSVRTITSRARASARRILTPKKEGGEKNG